jgi:hypothetical protein
MPQLGRTDVPVPVLVEHLERLLDLLLRVRVAHLTRHHGEELGEVDRPVSVCVNLVDHVLQLCLGRVLSQGAHDGAELFCRDRAIAVCRDDGDKRGSAEDMDGNDDERDKRSMPARSIGDKRGKRTLVEKREGLLELWMTRGGDSDQHRVCDQVKRVQEVSHQRFALNDGVHNEYSCIPRAAC